MLCMLHSCSLQVHSTVPETTYVKMWPLVISNGVECTHRPLADRLQPTRSAQLPLKGSTLPQRAPIRLWTAAATRRRQGPLVCAAQQKEGDLATGTPVAFLLDYAASLGITKDITRKQAYSVWLQGAVVLVILAAIDAAYSGDWSRIGVISHEVELGLRPLLGLLGLFHIFCGGIAAIAASRNGYNPVPATAKVLAVGFLALVEVLLKDPADGRKA